MVYTNLEIKYRISASKDIFSVNLNIKKGVF